MFFINYEVINLIIYFFLNIFFSNFYNFFNNYVLYGLNISLEGDLNKLVKIKESLIICEKQNCFINYILYFV